MFIVRVIGGMGNQMFQYAFGKKLQKLGKDVAYDLSWYKSKDALHPLYPRPFRLDKFQIPTIRLENCKSTYSIISESTIKYSPHIFERFKTKDHLNFHGWWQYYVYYKSIVGELQKEFQLKPEFYTTEYLIARKIIEESNSVSMHVRRGDYQLHRKGCFRDLIARYYFDAMKLIDGDLFIFSDDIEWCKETFKQEYFDRKITFIDLEDYLCFDLMRLCKNNINTNSTFSWWAALMNTNPNKKVICPITYQGDSVESSNKLRYPQEWIKIEDYAN